MGFVLFPLTFAVSCGFLGREHEALGFLVLVSRGVKRPCIQEQWVVTHGRMLLVLYRVYCHVSVKCGVLLTTSLRWAHLAWSYGTLTEEFSKLLVWFRHGSVVNEWVAALIKHLHVGLNHGFQLQSVI